MIFALSRYVKRVIVLTPINIIDLPQIQALRSNINCPENVMVIPLPIFTRSIYWPSRMLSAPCIAILITLIALYTKILDKFSKYTLIYLRDAISTWALFTLKALIRHIIIILKLGGLLEEDIRLPPKPLRRFYSYMIDEADRYAMSKARIIAVPSKLSYLNLVKRRRVISRGKVILLPAGIDLSKINSIKSHTEEKYNKNIFVVGFLGILNKYQGVDILMEAVNILKKRDKFENIEVLIIGDGPERRHIRARSKKYDIKCHITGSVPHEKALTYLRSLDILVLPRRASPQTESIMPIKILEAWAMGVPTITTHHKVYDALGIRDGIHTTFCELNRYSVADKIMTIAKNREYGQRIAAEAQKFVQTFSYEHHAERLMTVIRDIIVDMNNKLVT